MFNIGFAELILVLLIAFLIVGPKDLPKVARFLGRCVKWVRSIIAELKAESGWDDMMRETGDIRKDVDDAVKQMDLSREFREARKELNRSLNDAKRETYRENDGSAGNRQHRMKSAEPAEKDPDRKETESGSVPEPGEPDSEGEAAAPASWKAYRLDAERKAAGAEREKKFPNEEETESEGLAAILDTDQNCSDPEPEQDAPTDAELPPGQDARPVIKDQREE